MSQHNIAKMRTCRECGYRDKITAREMKEHAAKHVKLLPFNFSEVNEYVITGQSTSPYKRWFRLGMTAYEVAALERQELKKTA